MTPQDSADSLTGASPEEYIEAAGQRFSLQLSKARLNLQRILDALEHGENDEHSNYAD